MIGIVWGSFHDFFQLVFYLLGIIALIGIMVNDVFGFNCKFYSYFKEGTV
jgi:hypothetical protein